MIKKVSLSYNLTCYVRKVPLLNTLFNIQHLKNIVDINANTYYTELHDSDHTSKNEFESRTSYKAHILHGEGRTLLLVIKPSPYIFYIRSYGHAQ